MGFRLDRLTGSVYISAVLRDIKGECQTAWRYELGCPRIVSRKGKSSKSIHIFIKCIILPQIFLSILCRLLLYFMLYIVL